MRFLPNSSGIVYKKDNQKDNYYEVVSLNKLSSKQNFK